VIPPPPAERVRAHVDVALAALLEVGPVAGSQQRRTGAQGVGRALGPQPDHPGLGQGGEPQAAQGAAAPGLPGPPQHSSAQG
jgi:hypothetical protein